MTTLLRPAAVLLALFTVLTGLAYPLVVTAAANLFFPAEAHGSVVASSGRAVGSRLIGQHFDEPHYFWGRPSATSAVPYDGAASTGSNLGPMNPALVEAIRGRVDAVRSANPGTATATVPVDLVSTSGSGLDPDISPASAYLQVARVARARGIPDDRLRALVRSQIEGRTFGVLGEPRVDVLLLNLALDRLDATGRGAFDAEPGDE